MHPLFHYSFQEDMQLWAQYCHPSLLHVRELQFEEEDIVPGALQE